MNSYLKGLLDDVKPISLQLQQKYRLNIPLSVNTDIPTTINNTTSQTIARTTSQIVLTCRDEDLQDQNIESSSSCTTNNLPEVLDYKTNFELISTQSVSTLEAKLAKNTHETSTEMKSRISPTKKNSIYISDPTAKKNLLSQPSTTTAKPKIQQEINLYSFPTTPFEFSANKYSKPRQQVTDQFSSRYSITSEQYQQYTSSRHKKSISSSSSSNVSNYLTDIHQKSSKRTDETSSQYSFVDNSTSRQSLDENLNNNQINIKNEQVVEQTKEDHLKNANDDLPKGEDTIESTFSEMIAAISKLQGALKPVIENEQTSQTVEINQLKNELEVQNNALARSENEKDMLTQQLNQISFKIASLINPQQSQTKQLLLLPVSQLFADLEETLKQKDKQIDELQNLFREQQSLERNIGMNVLKEQFNSDSQKIQQELQQQQKNDTSIVKQQPISSSSVHCSPALRNQFQRPIPLGIQMINLPYYSVSINENQPPVSVTSTGGYNSFKARIDHLNSQREDRLSTSLRK